MKNQFLFGGNEVKPRYLEIKTEIPQGIPAHQTNYKFYPPILIILEIFF